MADRIGEPPRRGRLRTVRAVEAQGKAHDDALRFVAERNLCEPSREGFLGSRGHGRERLGDGLGWIAERDTHTLRSRIDRQNPH